MEIAFGELQHRTFHTKQRRQQRAFDQHEAAGKGKSSERGQGKESYEDVAVIGFDLRARPADFFLVGARQRVEAVVESRSDGAVGIVVAEGARSRRALVFSK